MELDPMIEIQAATFTGYDQAARRIVVRFKRRPDYKPGDRDRWAVEVRREEEPPIEIDTKAHRDLRPCPTHALEVISRTYPGT